jgi:hypothetical protein
MEALEACIVREWCGCEGEGEGESEGEGREWK